MASSADGPRTVLMVEDEVLIRMSVADYLRDCGYRVVEAGDAAEALEVLAAGDVDLVFTDVDMPGDMDGLALARWVRANRPGLPVIVASGVPRIVERAGEVCADGPLLAKPYGSESLATRIGALLALNHQGKRQEGAA